MGANGKKHLRRSKHHRPFPKQKPEYRKLRPLEPRERDWAAEHHPLVLRFLEEHHLSMEEYYDVVIFRYLLAVETGLRRPGKPPRVFQAAAWAAMTTALWREQRCRWRKSLLEWPAEQEALPC